MPIILRLACWKCRYLSITIDATGVRYMEEPVESDGPYFCDIAE